MIITNSNIDKAFIGFDTSFQQALQNTPTVWQDIASEKTSTDEQEVYMWADLVPELREFLGARVVNNLAGRSQTLVNKEYEGTVGVPRSKFEDDKYGVFTPQVAQLGVRAAQHPDKLVTDALIAGDTAVVYDGQFFFDTDHPQNPDDPASPTQSNKYTGMPLNGDNVGLGIAKMAGFKDAGGVPLYVQPDTLIVPSQLKFLAQQIIKSMSLAVAVAPAGTSPGGAAAPTNILQGALKLVVNPRLTSATKWYLADTSKAVKPLIYQRRIAPEFAYLNRPDDSNVFKHSEFLFGTRTRGAGGYGPYFLIAEFDQ